MKKNIPLVFFLLTSLISLSQSDIIISQYIETSSGSTPKGIEIFNVSGSDITFSAVNNLQVYKGANGAACTNLPGINIISGTLVANEVWVIGTPDLITHTTTTGTSFSGTTPYSFSFNGDDALQLYLGGVLQDGIGTCGSDPGSAWTGSGVSTANNNIQIKDGICDGETAGWTDPSLRYDNVSGGTVMTGFGDAPAACSSACTPTQTITSFSPTSGPIGTPVTIIGTGFTAGSTVNFNGTVAIVTFVNSTTLTAVVQAGTTTGLVSVTEAGCSLDSVSNFTISACTPTQTITSFAPTSGPELTHVTITGTGFTASSTVDFNGTSATIISQSAIQLVAEVPTGATTGIITVTEAGCPLDTTTDFTLLSGTCGSGSGGIPAGFTDLMFSGIYDDQTESCHYFELLNPTSASIDLTDYTIGLDNNFTLGSAVPTTGFTGGILSLTGTLAAESTIMIRLSASGTCTSCPSVTPDLSFTSGGVNDEDRLVLVKDYGTGSATAQDVWQNHTTPGTGYNVGYVFTRNNLATAPSTTFLLSDWDNDGNEDCFGFAITITAAPVIDTQPLDIDNCDAANVNVSVTASGSGTLSYQWKYNNGTSGWLDVTAGDFSPGIVTGATTDDLSITGFNLDGYQFYCEVTESGVCTIASDGIQIAMSNTIWDGATWSNGLPDLTKMVVLNGSYDTSINGSFQACSLIINSSGVSAENRLTITNNTFVEIENNVTVDGELYLQSQGSFVQNNNTSVFNLTSNGESLVNKQTTPINSIHEYTYWSSPVEDATINDALAFANPYRRFWFNAANFLDVLIEIGNTNTFTPGSDGIDDNGDDWTYISDGSMIMTPGVGYISMHTPTGFVPGSQYTYTFNGAFNTGSITSAVLYNGANGDEDWNLIGNPYPSAIDANAFLTANSSTIQGVAYLWSQNTPASATASGNQNANFSNSDYAIITTGSGNVAGGDMIIPADYIPSGQSFFVQAIANGNVSFNNDYRMADTSSNSQFFRTNTSANNKIWLNLTTDNGVFHQILVAYVNGATDGKDSMSYDANRTLYEGNIAEIFTSIPNETDKYAIQGKSPESLTIDEVIPVGFNTKIIDPTIYTFSIAQLEGLFFETNAIYLKDNLLNTYQDLTLGDYTFTSETGEFSARFEIVFTQPNLGVEEQVLATNGLSIIETQNDNVTFKLNSNNRSIKSVKIFDALGRVLYNLKGNSSVETYKLSNLSQATYIAQIELDNGLIISKKAIKK